jgi:hypothetical protein
METLTGMIDELMQDARQRHKALETKLLAIKEHVVELAKRVGSVECGQNFFIYWIPVFDTYVMRASSGRQRKVFSCELTPENTLNIVVPQGKGFEEETTDWAYVQLDNILKRLAELCAKAYLEENIYLYI